MASAPSPAGRAIVDPAAPEARNREALSIRLWGVRGSIPTPGADTVRYGGETTALEISAGPHTILIDCGSGVRLAGKTLSKYKLARADVLFTHTHMDHICGLPFFCLAYDPSVELNLWAGHIAPGDGLQDIVERMMSPPTFPVATSALHNTHFKSFKAGEPIVLGDDRPTVRTVHLNHPGNCCGYRIDWHGSSIAIITDHEHGNAVVDASVAAFVAGADLMIYDAMYLTEEYPSFVGWGHSTPDKALDLAEQAGIHTPVIFHHDPSRTDDQLDVINAAAKARVPGAEVARQGDTITLLHGKRVSYAADAGALLR